MNEDNLTLQLRGVYTGTDVESDAFDSVEDAAQASLNQIDKYALEATDIFKRLSQAAYGIKLDPNLEAGLVEVQNKTKSLSDAFNILQNAYSALTTSSTELSWGAVSTDLKEIADDCAESQAELAQLGYTLDDVEGAFIKLGVAEREAGTIGKAESDALLQHYAKLAGTITEVAQTTERQLPAVIQSSANGLQSLVNYLGQMQSGFTGVSDSVKQLPALIDTVQTHEASLNTYIEETYNKFATLMQRLDTAPSNMAGIDKIKNSFGQLSTTFVDITSQIQDGKLDVSSAFVGLDDINKKVKIIENSFNNFNGVINTLKKNHEQYNNSVQQSLAKQIQSEEELTKAKEQQANYSSSAYDKAIQKEEERKNFANKSARESAQVFIQAEKEKENAINKTASVAKQSINKTGTTEQILNIGKIIGSLRTLQTAFRSLNQAIEKNIKLAASAVKVYVSSFGKISTAVTKVAVTMSGLPAMLKGIASAASNIKSTLVSAFSGISVTDLLKQSSELQSQLKEVQNVVNVVFGKDGKQVIKDFASTAVRDLGMSTLAAEQFAGKFGAALTTTGQSRESVIQMSKALTTLTGDLASFYDIEQDVAASKLFSGVISGQIKPMRELGVDMTKASLAAYAAAEGYEKEYKDMSAAEKQAVRFKYVMDKLNFVHGDYLRTINSTANQLRLLKNQLKELGTVIGAIINAFINPLIHAFNNVLVVVTEAAKRLASIMGIKLDFGSRGAGLIELGDDFDETADSADDMAEAEDGATDSLHKLSKAAKGALSPLHKLNVLQNKQSKDTSNSDAASVISNLLDGLEDDVASDLPSIQDMIKNFLDWLWNLDWEGGLAKIIDKLNEWFKKLPDMIQDFFDNLQPWIERLAGLFNQLFKDLDWEGFGRTVSEVVEGIGRSLGTFLETLSTYDAGEALGKFINGLIKNQDMFTEWGKTIGLAIQRGFEFILGAVRKIEWGTLGTNLFAGLQKAFRQIDPETIKNAIYESLSGITETLNTFFTELENDEETRTKIKDSVLAVLNGGVEYLKNGGYDELVEHISKFISDAFNSLSEWLDTDENKEAIGGAIDKTIEGVGEVLKSGAKLASSIKSYLVKALGDFFTSNDIPFEVKLAVAVKAADLTGITDLARFIVEGLIAAKLLGILGVVGELGLAVGAIVAEYKLLDALLYKITGEHSSWEGSMQAMGNFIQIIYSLLAGISVLLIHGIADVIDTIGDMLQEFPGIGTSIQQTFDAAAEKLRTVASQVAQGNQEVANSIYGWTHSYSAVDGKVKETSGIVSQATNEEAAMYEKMADSVASSYDKIGTKGSEAATSVTDNLKGAKDTVTTDWDSETDRMGFFQSLVDGSNDVYKQLDENTKTAVSSIDSDLSSIGTSTDFASTASNYNEQLLVPLTENTQTATQQITESIQNIATALGEETFAAVAEQFLTGVVEPIKTGVEELAIAIEQGFTTAKNNTQTVWESFSGWWTIEVTQKITDNITQSIESIETLNTTAYDSITQIWTALPEFIDTNIVQKIIELLGGIFEKSEADTETSVDAMKDAWTSLAEHIQSILDDISSSLDDMVSKAQEAASAIADAASSSSSSSSYYRGYPSSVQGYANGGVFRPNTPQLAILGDNKSQTEYALTTGHLREIASMMASAIDAGGNSGVESITVPIYLGTELIDQEIINVGNMHNYRSNGR